MIEYQILSVLLTYPSQPLVDAVPEIRRRIATEVVQAAYLEPLLLSLEATDLITLQERYVQIFDRTPSCSLHLFEHIHGEDRERGQAMVDLLQEYHQHGFTPAGGELPDYLPLLLEFTARIAPEAAAKLMAEAIDVIAHIGQKLRQQHSLYAGVLEVLVRQSGVGVQPLVEPPVRDMDEMLERFGPGPEGTEPLLQPYQRAAAMTPIKFYRQRPASGYGQEK